MSVVKKYEKGKAINRMDYANFIADKIKNTKFTKAGLSLATQAAKKFDQLMQSGKFEEAYSFDPISNTYSIDANKLPDELKENI
jgi:hypothetical protein